MRLGEYDCIIENNSLAKKIYNSNEITERHRHRYEVNNSLSKLLEKKGLKISGRSKNKNLIEIIEYEKHPWFLCCQFHPEFNSNPRTSHPLFLNYIDAVIKNKKNN